MNRDGAFLDDPDLLHEWGKHRARVRLQGGNSVPVRCWAAAVGVGVGMGGCGSVVPLGGWSGERTTAVCAGCGRGTCVLCRGEGHEGMLCGGGEGEVVNEGREGKGEGGRGFFYPGW